MHNLFVYFVIFIWEYGTWHCIVSIFFCTIGFLIAACRLLPMFLNDLTMEWDKLHINKKCIKVDQRLQFQLKFYEIIQAHSKVKQLSPLSLDRRKYFFSMHTFLFRFACEMVHICQYILTSLYLWALLSICTSSLLVLIQLVECIISMSILRFKTSF